MNTSLISESISALEQFGTVFRNRSMSELTSFHTGGTADIIIYPDSIGSVSKIISHCNDNGIPYIVLGGCTNLVVSDSGIRGVVIKISNDGICDGEIRLLDNGDIYADAGIYKKDFISFAVKSGKSGIQFMAGIPGCIGGGIIMNAGTFMGTFSDILISVNYIDRKGNLKVTTIDRNMGNYRLLTLPEDMSVITGGTFRLSDAIDPAVVQHEIDEIIQDRKIKHPWEYPSAGSVFKNPEDNFSWKLVNDAGLKGFSVGGATVSDKHTNFIINSGNATSTDIRNLIVHVQNCVKEKFNIDLHTEVRLIGDF